MSDCVSAQFLWIIEKNTITNLHLPPPLKMVIHKQEVIFLFASCLQEMVLLLASMKSH